MGELNIPMNTRGTMDSSSLLNLNNGPAYNNNNTNTANSISGQMMSSDNIQNFAVNQNSNGQQQGYNSNNNMNQNIGQNTGYNNMNQNMGYNQGQQQNYNNSMNQNQSQSQSYGQQQPVQQGYPQQQVQQPVVKKQRPPEGKGVHLKKGQKTSLVPANGGQLTSLKVCLGWDIKNQACDLDASAFILGGNGKVLGDDWFVFYGQTQSPDNSIRHSGDSQDGSAEGDDEVIYIDLQRVNNSVAKITFVVTINEALENHLNFSMVANAYARVVDGSTGAELARFSLTDYYDNVTSMIIGELYKHNNEWKFNAVGNGVARDLAGLCEMYGVNVAD